MFGKMYVEAPGRGAESCMPLAARRLNVPAAAGLGVPATFLGANASQGAPGGQHSSSSACASRARSASLPRSSSGAQPGSSAQGAGSLWRRRLLPVDVIPGE